MKKILPLLLIIAASLSACKKTCDDFHEGKKCETEVREKYYGKYYGAMSSSNAVSYTSTEVKPNLNAPNLVYFDQLAVELKGDDYFEIPSQPQIINNQSAMIIGFGTFSGDVLAYNLKVTIGNSWYYMYFNGTSQK